MGTAAELVCPQVIGAERATVLFGDEGLAVGSI